MHAVTRISGSAPRGPAAQTSTGAALKLPYSPGWVALAHPDQWTIVRGEGDEYHVLPKLSRLMLIPGIGGMRTTRAADGKRVADPRLAVAEMVSRGYVEIPSVDVVAGGLRQPHYCVRYPTAAGVTHLWAWEIPEVTHSQRSRTYVDRGAQVAFLRWVASDLLHTHTAPDDIIEGMRNDLRANASKYAIEARSKPTRASVAEHLAAMVVSLGWADGLDLSRPAARRVLGEGAVPVSSHADDALRAELEALRAELAALRATTPAPPAGAAPPVSSGDTGEAGALGLTLPDDDIPPDNVRPARPLRPKPTT